MFRTQVFLKSPAKLKCSEFVTHEEKENGFLHEKNNQTLQSVNWYCPGKDS